MVVIEITKSDLLKLVGQQIPDEELIELLFLQKIESKIDANKIECELNPDRPDMFSVEGIARALSGFMKYETGLQTISLTDSGFILKKEVTEVRPHIACAVALNVNMTEELIKSLMQLQEKLHSTIGRDRRKVAIGVHDYDKITPPLRYNDMMDERFTPLDSERNMDIRQILAEHPKGKEYAHLLHGKYPIIYDKNGVISFPPIINSDRTKLTSETKNLFIDVTGTDENSVNVVLNIIVFALASRGAKIQSVKVVNRSTPQLEPESIELNVEEIDRLLGLGLTEEQIVETLERMRYGVTKKKGGRIEVMIPAYRADILHKVDIIEDVAIGYGYNNIEPILPKVPTIGGLSKKENYTSTIRDLMIGFGFTESINFVLTGVENNFTKMGISGAAVELANPVSNEYSICRTWILPSLMKILMKNQHVEYPQKIFEIGDVVLPEEKAEVKTKTVRKLAGVISSSTANLTEIKSTIESLLKNLGLKYEIRSLSHPSFIENRCGEIIINGLSAGMFGEISPQILSNWNIGQPVIAFEISLENVI